MDKVLLGFTVPGGEPFYIPTHHSVTTGMTDLSGKTTTVQAVLTRREGKSLVFITKRGEKTFLDAHKIQPYYRERFDWEYVRSLLEASMKERLKFETPWIIRVCKQAQRELAGKDRVSPGEGLRVVRKLLGSMLTAETRMRELDRNMYTLLAAYLDKVLPVLEEASREFTDKLELREGINVMDLTEWYTHEEVQMLVIRSCMEVILEKENNVIVALPESWKMLPQSRNTPVKLYFEKFIREGATNGNFLYIDAQDLGGVDKTPLRQVSVWIMGKMMEANEVERLIKQTLGLKVPAEEIQTLPLGHFMVACGEKVKKVYVLPAGVPESVGVEVARGTRTPESVRDEFLKPKVVEVNDLVWKEKYEEEKRKREQRDKEFDFVKAQWEKEQLDLNKEICEAEETIKQLKAELEPLDELRRAFGKVLFPIEAETMKKIDAILAHEPSEVSVSVQPTLTEFTVKVPKREVIEATDKDPAGQMLILAHKGWFKERRRTTQVRDELKRVFNSSPRPGTIETALGDLTAKGILEREREGTSWIYWLAPEAEKLIKVEEF